MSFCFIKQYDSMNVISSTHSHPTLSPPTSTPACLDMIKSINDPEHPWTLEELNVLQQAHIEVDNTRGTVSVFFTPTIPHCSMATLIGLSIRVKLLRVLPERFKVKGISCFFFQRTPYAVNTLL